MIDKLPKSHSPVMMTVVGGIVAYRYKTLVKGVCLHKSGAVSSLWIWQSRLPNESDVYGTVMA